MKTLLLILALGLSILDLESQSVLNLKYKNTFSPQYCGCSYNSWCTSYIYCGFPGCDFVYNPGHLDFRVDFQVPPPSGIFGINPYRMTVELYYNISNLIGTAYLQTNTTSFSPTFLYVPTSNGHFIAKILLEKRTILGWKTVDTYWTNMIDMSFCPWCSHDVTVTSGVSIPLTQSDTWIKSSGQTTIINTSSVVFDADPALGYVLLEPTSGSDFFLSSPISNGKFVAQALDGCGYAMPFVARPSTEAEEAIEESASKTLNQELRESELKIFPNPSRDFVWITFTGQETNALGMEIRNLMGQVVFQDHLINGEKYQLNTSQMESGVYFITAKDMGKQVMTRKLVIQR